MRHFVVKAGAADSFPAKGGGLPGVGAGASESHLAGAWGAGGGKCAAGGVRHVLGAFWGVLRARLVCMRCMLQAGEVCKIGAGGCGTRARAGAKVL